MATAQTAREVDTPAHNTLLRQRKQEPIPADRLSQAPEYARPLRPHWVASLARTWNNLLVGELLVSKRGDGSIRLMTGNHRWAARLLRREGHLLFHCLTYTGLTVAEEAEIYLAQDKNKLRHTAADDFLAMVQANDPVALTIKDIVADLGLHITPYGAAGYGRTRIRAVSALLRAYETSGHDALYTALLLIRDHWLPGVLGTAGSRRSAFSEATILPLAAFVHVYGDDPNFKLPNLRSAMDRDDLAAYEHKYNAQRMAASARPTAGVATLYGVLALLDSYNYGRRVENRLDEAVARKSAQTRFGEARANAGYTGQGTTPIADARRFIEGLEIVTGVV